MNRAEEYWQSVIESQIEDPDLILMNGLRLNLAFDLFECITDEQIEYLVERVKFARLIKSEKPIF